MSNRYPSTTLTLVRHGQARATDGSYHDKIPLTELGRRQASALADELATGTPPDVVYTSPFPRAVETSMPLCETLGVEAIVDERLAEFEVPSSASVEAIYQRPDLAVWKPEHTGVEDGETLAEFSVRVGRFCEETVGRHLQERIVIFAHAGTIDAAIRWSLGMSPSASWQHEFDISNASITEVEYWPRGRVPGGAPRYAALYRVGDAAHLGDLASDI